MGNWNPDWILEPEIWASLFNLWREKGGLLCGLSSEGRWLSRVGWEVGHRLGGVEDWGGGSAPGFTPLFLPGGPGEAGLGWPPSAQTEQQCAVGRIAGTVPVLATWLQSSCPQWLRTWGLAPSPFLSPFPTLCMEQVRELSTWQTGRPWVSHCLGTEAVVHTKKGNWEEDVCDKRLGPVSIWP